MEFRCKQHMLRKFVNILAWEIVTYEVQHNSPGQLSLNQNSSQSLGTSQGPQAHTARFNIYAIRMQAIYVAYVHLWRLIAGIWLRIPAYSTLKCPSSTLETSYFDSFCFPFGMYICYQYIHRCDYCNPLPLALEGLRSWYVKPRRPSELIC